MVLKRTREHLKQVFRSRYYDLKLDEVYGPIQRNNAYSIIQVIERKDSDDSLNLSFESIKNDLRNELRFNRLSEQLKNITSNLAEKNNVKINLK